MFIGEKMMSSHRHRKVQVVFLLAIAVEGVVHPFTFSSTPEVAQMDRIRSRDLPHSLLTPNPFLPPSQTYIVSQTALAESSSTVSEVPRRKAGIRRFLSRRRQNNGTTTHNKSKVGENSASIPSRMFFRYVSPLLDIASQRTLSEDDAFELKENQSIDRSVESLASVYNEGRRSAQRKIESKGGDKFKSSQSAILLKALLKQQRGALLLTGVLRLLNTGVQAFPAVLVSRLLRTIEAGNAVPASKAYQAAILLVSVLTLKTVVENQFFHNVVSMATKTRGSLEGLIFDKSLRLPNGGIAVMADGPLDEKKVLGSGGVLNLMQTDASIIENAIRQIHTIWDGPLQVSESLP